MIKTPISYHEIDHDVVVVDVFNDADGASVSAQAVVDAVNDSAGLQSHLALCVSALLAAGVVNVSFVDDALAALDGKSGTANGREWSCAQGRITWQS